jgi:hypothetical protein
MNHVRIPGRQSSNATLLLTVLFSLLPAAASAAFIVEAECKNCIQLSSSSLNPLYRENQFDPVTLAWDIRTTTRPVKGKLRLYAGNPALQADLPIVEELNVEENTNEWALEKTFQPDDLGSGTLITVWTLIDGNDERILDWRAWRMLTRADHERELAGPPRATNWELDLRPSVLNVSTSRGDIPSSLGGDEPIWWSLADMQTDLSDLDIDGENNGSPGLGVRWSAPWHARDASGDSLTNEIKDLLVQRDDLPGHLVRFENMEWIEDEPREIVLPDGVIDLRSYYTVVTLFTNATLRTFEKKELGQRSFGERTYFAHETSARLKNPESPLFWASYNAREYGHDRALLPLLQDQLKDGKRVSGLPMISQDDGDGGSTVYRLGFTADVVPWREGKQYKAGVVALDVVASRVGVGRLVSEGYTGESKLERVWCAATGCDSEGSEVNLSKPPKGYKVWQHHVANILVEGVIPLVDDFSVGQRDADNPTPVILRSLPSRINFALPVEMRAGAITRRDGWRGQKVENMIPINTYAQYVLRIKLALTEDNELIVDDQAQIPSADSVIGGNTSFPPKNPTLWEKILDVLDGLKFYVYIAIGLLLAMFLPGFLSLLSAFFQLIATLVRGLDNVMRRLLGRPQKPDPQPD